MFSFRSNTPLRGTIFGALLAPSQMRGWHLMSPNEWPSINNRVVLWGLWSLLAFVLRSCKYNQMSKQADLERKQNGIMELYFQFAIFECARTAKYNRANGWMFIKVGGIEDIGRIMPDLAQVDRCARLYLR
ncbi:hypothetical protein AVEN_136632-1 [Araneus ventricosus]|uniref:Uncharacterized protein n=1 Tax=Araneus ventricosus TaxID=182803 RepID=A0A4Y2CB94_ARAVE|nr:hypothetical protein AVEN_136632-1 [Araneus ventricosus]